MSRWVGIVMVVLMGVVGGQAQGKTISVDDDGPADFDNIQAAINAANDGDTVLVADGTYTGPGDRDIDFIGKAITVRSQNGPENCIIDCEGIRRGFYFHSDEDTNSILDGLTITNGYASNFYPQQAEWSGGGILCRGGSPTIRNCILTGNTTHNGTGGGIRASGGIISNCLIRENYAIGLGQFGPGGGGISCGGNTIVSNCIISGNTAVSSGGGIRCTGSNVRIINCTIVGNSGGGIDCHWNADSLISNCTVSGNHSAGVICLDSSPTLINSIHWDNSSEEISMYCLYRSSSITISYSNIQGGEPVAEEPCTINWLSGNINAYPYFADPGYWISDEWINGDYHLKSQGGRYDSTTQSWTYDDVTSPCIDTGNSYSPIGEEPFPNGGVVNMGAYGGTTEASKSHFSKPPCEIIVAGDVNGDCLVNFLDFRLMALHWCEDNSP